MKTLSGGGRGVTLMALDPKETLLQALAIDPAGVRADRHGSRRQRRRREAGGAALAPHVGKRARKGRAPESKMKLDGMRPVLAA